MKRFKVVVSNPTVPKLAYQLLKDRANVVISPSQDKETILKTVPGADGLLWATKIPLNREILEATGPQLKVIGTMSAGYDHIDVNELKRRDIKLANVPHLNSSTVADVALLLALGASRRITEGRWHIEQGTWPKDFDIEWLLGQDLNDSTVGIIGFGGIGQGIATRLKAFGVSRILYTGHKPKPEADTFQAQFTLLDYLIRESDFIFLSAPLTSETYSMCNEDFFLKMKKTAIIINVSRGELVDQDALIKALKTGQIFAAGLDVMLPEPLNPDSELLKLPNVVLIPHRGSATRNVRDQMIRHIVENILLGLHGQEMTTPVI